MVWTIHSLPLFRFTGLSPVDGGETSCPFLCTVAIGILVITLTRAAENLLPGKIQFVIHRYRNKRYIGWTEWKIHIRISWSQAL